MYTGMLVFFFIGPEARFDVVAKYRFRRSVGCIDLVKRVARMTSFALCGLKQAKDLTFLIFDLN